VSADLSDRRGFDRDFLGFETPVPVPFPEIADDILKVEIEPGTWSAELRYQHFSLALSASRRTARWVAWNIDGTTRAPKGAYDRIGFRGDPRVPRKRQILGTVYRRNNLDRGHLARREDLLWGPPAAARLANDDSFYFTNIAPQQDDFNKASAGGVWGRLEDSLLDQIDLNRHRVSLLAGPVLAADDPRYQDIQVPREFWKLFVYRFHGETRVKAFMLSQTLAIVEEEAPLKLPEYSTFEIGVDELEARILLDLTEYQAWEGVQLEVGRAPNAIENASKIRW